MNNATRRQLLQRHRQSGFPGSILDVYKAYDQGIDLIGQFEQQNNIGIANTPEQQQQGLRPAHQAGDINQSMVFPDVPPNTNFNTMGMKAPINIQKFDEQGHLVKSYENVPPGVQSLPTGPQRGTVIETPANMQSGGTYYPTAESTSVSTPDPMMLQRLADSQDAIDLRELEKRQAFEGPLGMYEADPAGLTNVDPVFEIASTIGPGLAAKAASKVLSPVAKAAASAIKPAARSTAGLAAKIDASAAAKNITGQGERVVQGLDDLRIPATDEISSYLINSPAAIREGDDLVRSQFASGTPNMQRIEGNLKELGKDEDYIQNYMKNLEYNRADIPEIRSAPLLDPSVFGGYLRGTHRIEYNPLSGAYMHNNPARKQLALGKTPILDDLKSTGYHEGYHSIMQQNLLEPFRDKIQKSLTEPIPLKYTLSPEKQYLATLDETSAMTGELRNYFSTPRGGLPAMDLYSSKGIEDASSQILNNPSLQRSFTQELYKRGTPGRDITKILQGNKNQQATESMFNLFKYVPAAAGVGYGVSQGAEYQRGGYLNKIATRINRRATAKGAEPVGYRRVLPYANPRFMNSGPVYLPMYRGEKFVRGLMGEQPVRPPQPEYDGPKIKRATSMTFGAAPSRKIGKRVKGCAPGTGGYWCQ